MNLEKLSVIFFIIILNIIFLYFRHGKEFIIFLNI